ncbi:allophanate hydrolase subunit 1 [Nocardioides marmoriginsengisoli]|uniref:Allophanate hydrolase subunit 1 n=1 Tax=Nocardioides marmoriginsengisoli TaxID=661483 RepID=A0A3N0CN72_9ACTN|nr:allophanate hydrolase subunit 1 [Nocardioides marmoriginsengisoli]RNL64917.1 allophanate hydrolase subunit 1 [Nocardioides marmoriginsengisoli]
MELRRVGEHGLLVVCPDAAAVRAAYAELRARADELGAVEVVPAARTVLLDGLADAAATQAALTGWEPEPGAENRSGDLVEIPTRYDGPDLDEVARQWETTTADVVRTHQATEFVVAFCGFAPGFAYCTGLPETLSVRRKEAPRASVPAGSVALAAEYTSVYPSSSPGGWQLIGRTDLALWDPAAGTPALLMPGTRVRFTDA